MSLTARKEREVGSVTRLLVYVFNLGYLQQWNFAQYHTLFCQSRVKMLPTLNKPSKYCQSGEISPNLVTLEVESVTLINEVFKILSTFVMFYLLSGLLNRSFSKITSNCSVTRLGDLLVFGWFFKALILSPNRPKFWNGVKIFHLCRRSIFGQLFVDIWHFLLKLSGHPASKRSRGVILIRRTIFPTIEAAATDGHLYLNQSCKRSFRHGNQFLASRSTNRVTRSLSKSRTMSIKSCPKIVIKVFARIMKIVPKSRQTYSQNRP